MACEPVYERISSRADLITDRLVAEIRASSVTAPTSHERLLLERTVAHQLITGRRGVDPRYANGACAVTLARDAAGEAW